MSDKTHSSKRIAILVSSGFIEEQLTQIQKFCLDSGGYPRIISAGSGLVSGWRDGGWGCHYAIDVPLEKTLASDFDMLFVPGGRGSVNKLAVSLHTKRILSSFLNARKPVAVYDEAVELLIHNDLHDPYEISAPQDLMKEAVRKGAQISDSAMFVSGNLATFDTSRIAMAETLTSVQDLMRGALIDNAA